MTICQAPACDEHFACRLRAKGLQVAPSATPSRHNRRGGRTHDAPWERGIVTETRPDGSKMPLLEPGTRHPLHLKQYSEQRHAIDEQVRNLKTRRDPLPDTPR